MTPKFDNLIKSIIEDLDYPEAMENDVRAPRSISIIKSLLSESVGTQAVSVTKFVTIPEDLARAEADAAKGGGLKWAMKVNLEEPVGAFFDENGELYLYDGHHRYVAARMRGEPLRIRNNVFEEAGIDASEWHSYAVE
jgi:hypothetical protein